MNLPDTLYLLAAFGMLTVCQLVSTRWLFAYLKGRDDTRYSETLRLKELTIFCVHELRAATHQPKQEESQ